MTEILVLRGLPASGKTTFARGLESTHVRVSRDEIRRTLTGRTDKFAGDHKFEEKVTEVQEDLVRLYIRNGRSVVIDDMNLRQRYVRRWVTLAARLGVEADVMAFKVPLPELLERNARRFDPVPEALIRDLYERFSYRDWKPVIPDAIKEVRDGKYVPNTSLPPCVTVDLDGTLALHTSGRNPYDSTRYLEDTLNEPLAEVLAYLRPHVKIGVFTGRGEQHREVCEQWLDEMGVDYDFMLMRPADEPDKKDHLVKEDLFRKHIAGAYNHLIHFDDRDRVVDRLREVGVQVAQVARGNF